MIFLSYLRIFYQNLYIFQSIFCEDQIVNKNRRQLYTKKNKIWNGNILKKHTTTDSNNLEQKKMQSFQITNNFWEQYNNKMSILSEKNHQQQELKKRLQFLKKHYRFGKRKRECIEYYCFCDKKYCSFAAVYLHAKLKHSYRIKSTLEPGTCQVAVKGEKTVLRFISPSSIGDEDRNSEKIDSAKMRQFSKKTTDNTIMDKQNIDSTDILSVLTVFTKEFVKNKDQEIKNVVSKVIEQFKDFLAKQVANKLKSPNNINQIEAFSLSQIQGEYIPTYFNKFIIQIIINENKTHTFSAIQACYTLQNLGKWMLQNHKTCVQVEYDSNFFATLPP